MLSLTKKTEYGLIAACHLARHAERAVSARDIAERYGVPLPLLMNVLKILQRKGYVRSTRGARGGYALASPPQQITLMALAEALEGPVRLVACVPGVPSAPAVGGEPSELGCELQDCCAIRGPILRLHERLQRFLAGVTVADIACDGRFDERYVELESPTKPSGMRAIAE
jgi:Rrf2 family protein